MWALGDRASRQDSKTSSIVRGDSVFYWNFTLADEVMDSIVVRKCWGIPKGVDVQRAADEMAVYVHNIYLNFMDFCGEYVWKYFD